MPRVLEGRKIIRSAGLPHAFRELEEADGGRRKFATAGNHLGLQPFLLDQFPAGWRVRKWRNYRLGAKNRVVLID